MWHCRICALQATLARRVTLLHLMLSPTASPRWVLSLCPSKACASYQSDLPCYVLPLQVTPATRVMLLSPLLSPTASPCVARMQLTHHVILIMCTAGYSGKACDVAAPEAQPNSKSPQMLFHLQVSATDAPDTPCHVPHLSMQGTLARRVTLLRLMRSPTASPRWVSKVLPLMHLTHRLMCHFRACRVLRQGVRRCCT
jgi:hypothetical protein